MRNTASKSNTLASGPAKKFLNWFDKLDLSCQSYFKTLTESDLKEHFKGYLEARKEDRHHKNAEKQVILSLN